GAAPPLEAVTGEADPPPAARAGDAIAQLDNFDVLGSTGGYLGRAHPLVRRALDRVRHLSFGTTADSGQDLRASAAAADVPEPTLLFTFLGRIESKAGRELEQVLAVQITASGDREWLPNPGGWLSLVESARAIRTTGLYEQHFAAWFEGARAQARELAEREFHDGSSAAAFVTERRRDLEAERGRLDDWLRQLADAIAPRSAAPALQLDLFAQAGGSAPGIVRAWQEIADPQERLAAFHNDRLAAPRLRGDAEHAIRIFAQRSADIEARLALRPPEVLPLGVLMLVPTSGSTSR
ncbi:MAG: hypothetical protein HGA45_35310, partial [Chloroflexales bacterium]|nr:hypothetical protein [Chloroflexales bacterium]